METADMSQLSFEERFALLVDQQWRWKENRALARRLRSAKLKERGSIEDIDYQHPRGLDRRLISAFFSAVACAAYLRPPTRNSLASFIATVFPSLRLNAPFC